MGNVERFCVGLILMCAMVSVARGGIDGIWHVARATFYGDISGNETMRACGYGDMFKQGYALETTALSTALFNDGLSCGQCFEIRCVNLPQWSWCKPRAGKIKVTATNFCPPNPSGGWCNPPQRHFDLTLPMFLKIAIYQAGVIPVRYRRVHCTKQGGVKFEMNGNPYWTLVLVYNVGGSGGIKDMKIKGSNTRWLQMTRNWGQNWQTQVVLTGQSLSFQVTTDDGVMIQFDNVAPADWRFKQTYDGRKNF